MTKDYILISEELPEPDRDANFTLKVQYDGYFGLLIAKYLIHEDSPDGKAEWFVFNGEGYHLLRNGKPVAWEKDKS